VSVCVLVLCEQWGEARCIRMHMWLQVAWLLFSSCWCAVFTTCRTLSMLFLDWWRLLFCTLHPRSHSSAALEYRAVFSMGTWCMYTSFESLHDDRAVV
jgi:hypothetical protein